jgi:hypothetical protein
MSGPLLFDVVAHVVGVAGAAGLLQHVLEEGAYKPSSTWPWLRLRRNAKRQMP